VGVDKGEKKSKKQKLENGEKDKETELEDGFVEVRCEGMTIF
jgi:hypothetical protein